MFCFREFLRSQILNAIELALSQMDERWTLLILDDETTKILASCFRMHELTKIGVSGLANINKKRPRLMITPIYLLSPNIRSISGVIHDYKRRKRSQYNKVVHLYLSSKISPEGMELIKKSRLRKYLKTFQEIFCDIIALESFVYSYARPEAFRNIYNNPNVEHELKYAAEKLFTVCNSLKELPYIRYDRWSLRATKLAQLFKKYHDERRQNMANLRAKGNRATLLILDRAHDPAAPLLHEITYQSMIKDLIGGSDITVTVPNERYDENDEKSLKELTLDYSRDLLWDDLRLENIAKARVKLKAKFGEFVKREGVTDEHAGIGKLTQAVRKLPHQKKMRQSFTLHFMIMVLLVRLYKEQNLANVADLEQSLLTGLTDQNKTLNIKQIQKSLSKILKNSAVGKDVKLRLLLIYLIARGGVSRLQLKILCKASNFSNEDIKVIVNLEKIGITIVEEKRILPSPLYYREIQKRARELNKSTIIQSRYEPLLSLLLTKLNSGMLSVADFPFRGDVADLAHAVDGENINDRARVIIFVIGGMCWSEIRMCYKKSEELKRYIYLGSSHVMSPNDYVKLLRGLTEDSKPSWEESKKKQCVDIGETDSNSSEGLKWACGEYITDDIMAPEAEQNSESWQDIVAHATEDKLGWRLWNGRVLLCEASKKFGRCITLKQGTPIPFNETRDWWEQDGQDHWFQITPIQSQVNPDQQLPGQIFTARMPRGLDEQAGDDFVSVPNGATDKRRLVQKIKDNSIVNIFVLAQNPEFVSGKSESLIQFYKKLGILVVQIPTKDYTTLPPVEEERWNIEALSISLANGENCLVHCYDGDRRTGIVLIGLLLSLGVRNVLKWCRRIKSVYLDIQEQDHVFEHQLSRVEEHLKKVSPHSIASTVRAQIELLCSNKVNNLFDVDTDFPDEVIQELRMLFSVMQVYGDAELVTIQELYKFIMALNNGRSEILTESSITLEALRNLFGNFYRNVLMIPSNFESVTFDMFIRILKLKVFIGENSEKILSEVTWSRNGSSDAYHGERMSIRLDDGPIIKFNDLSFGDAATDDVDDSE